MAHGVNRPKVMIIKKKLVKATLKYSPAWPL